MELSERLYRLAKNVAGKQIGDIEKLFGESKVKLESILDDWEKSLNIGWDEPEVKGTKGEGSAAKNQSSQYSKQYLEDLMTFGLVPPVSFDEIKKARNGEMKKYHADKFMSNPEKKKTAEQIMQIYNEAFERLKKTP